MNHPLPERAFATLRRSLAFALPSSLIALALIGCSGDPGSQDQDQPPAPVSVTELSITDATYHGEYAGRVRGEREVEIRARVSGILEERRYAEGELVEQGETLFQIEPGPYQTAVRSAKAELADARSRLSQAESEWRRVEGLYERDAVSTRERDQAKAEHEAAKSRQEAAESALADAERNLRYTRVEAPVSGITGMEAVSEGNLIEPGTLLTHLTQHDPVRVLFSLPENDASAQRLAREARRAGGDEARQEVQLLFRGGDDYEHAGEVNFSDRRIDAMTGGVQMRAQFPNPDGDLIPGQFVRVRLALESFDSVFLIEPSAVGEGPEGPQVFVVEDDTAHARQVELGPIVEGKQVILDGLSEGEQLVINGQVALGDGAPVSVTSPTDEEG